MKKPFLAALLCSSLFWIAPAKAQTHHDSCATPPCTIISGVAADLSLQFCGDGAVRALGGGQRRT